MENELTDGYYITLKNYQALLGDGYNTVGYFPNYLIQYPILLPFHVPFPDGFIVSYGITDDLKLSYVFSTIVKEYDHTESLELKKRVRTPICYSRIEMIYATKGTVDIRDKHQLSQMFNQLLHYLNCIITAYTFIKRDYFSFAITKEMLPVFCFVQLFDLHNLYHVENILFYLHLDIPYVRKELSISDARTISSLAFNLNARKNNFFPSTEFMYLAQRNCVKGFFRESIVFCQTSIESLLRTLLLELIELESLPQEEIDKILDSPFIRRVKREYSGRLGGNWNIDDESVPIGKWYSNTYSQRNRVVHGGFEPSFKEADLSINSSMEFVNYLISLLKTKQLNTIADKIINSWFMETI